MLALVAAGLANQQISRRLGLAARTVDEHLENTFAELDAPLVKQLRPVVVNISLGAEAWGEESAERVEARGRGVSQARERESLERGGDGR